MKGICVLIEMSAIIGCDNHIQRTVANVFNRGGKNATAGSKQGSLATSGKRNTANGNILAVNICSVSIYRARARSCIERISS